VNDLDSDRMLIRVEGGKARKDRDTVLEEQLLLELRESSRRIASQSRAECVVLAIAPRCAPDRRGGFDRRR
jgi:hypothetical protein